MTATMLNTLFGALEEKNGLLVSPFKNKYFAFFFHFFPLSLKRDFSACKVGQTPGAALNGQEEGNKTKQNLEKEAELSEREGRKTHLWVSEGAACQQWGFARSLTRPRGNKKRKDRTKNLPCVRHERERERAKVDQMCEGTR